MFRSGPCNSTDYSPSFWREVEVTSLVLPVLPLPMGEGFSFSVSPVVFVFSFFSYLTKYSTVIE